jgi:hypothetical protein
MEVFGKVGELGMYALQQLDKLSAMATVSGAYEKYMVEHNLPIDLKIINPEAMKYAQLVLRRTQSSGLFKDVSAAVGRGGLTGNRSLDKILLQFQSFMLNKWSIIRHDVWRAGIKEKDPKKAIGMMFWLMLATLAGAGIRTGINSAKKAVVGRDQDDFTQKLWQNFTQEALGQIPFVGQVVSSASYGSMPVPALAVIKSLFDELGWVLKGKKAETKIKAAGRLAFTAAEIAGIPGAAEAKSWYTQMMKKKKSQGIQI